jgi:predicted transcriptional regulator
VGHNVCGAEHVVPAPWKSSSEPGGLWQNADMARRRVTVSLGEDVVRALDHEAERAGKSRSQIVEQTLARELAGAAIEHIWSSSQGPSLTDEEAMELAYSELHAMRRAKRAAS